MIYACACVCIFSVAFGACGRRCETISPPTPPHPGRGCFVCQRLSELIYQWIYPSIYISLSRLFLAISFYRNRIASRYLIISNSIYLPIYQSVSLSVVFIFHLSLLSPQYYLNWIGNRYLIISDTIYLPICLCQSLLLLSLFSKFLCPL